jgi:DNA-binding PadR family transcriptional regulator
MAGPLTTRAALLQVLRQAPGYGSDLIRRFTKASGDDVHLAPARVYPVLKEIEAEGLVAAVRLAPGGRRGARARIYYDLTPSGLEAATKDRNTLLALLAAPTPLSASEGDRRERMAERLLAADELSELGAARAVAAP